MDSSHIVKALPSETR